MTEGKRVTLPPLAQPLSQIGETQPDAIVVGEGDSLDLLQAIYRNSAEPIGRRLRAAVAALPFERPKLAVTAHIDGSALGDRLERAIARSGKLIEAQAIKAIETEPVPKPG
jgi:hypothetical protein